MLYYFILGKNPTLSTLEITAWLKKEKWEFKINQNSAEVLLMEIKTPFEPAKLLDQLGGTIKIGRVLTEAEINKITPELIASQLTPVAGKFHFGFSTYTLAKSNFHLPKNFGLEVKRLLKEKNISCRLVTSKEKNLSSVVVQTNNLLKNGAEICLLTDWDKVYIGQTLTIQKFAEYSQFDYGRPGRDAHSGMLPPKIAKMMINLAQLPTSAIILDPFCGSGTILQQASLMGYQNLVGSDISAKATVDTQKNFEFTNSPEPTLYQLDSRTLSTRLKPKSTVAIITEPYLGPTLGGHEPMSKIKKIISELSDLYLKSFIEFKKILQPGGRVIIIFPIINGLPAMNNEQLEQIQKLGFKNTLEIPAELNNLTITPRHSIIYARPDQKVQREIFVFTQK
ncbi:MAG: DNA methyltransferase [Patescibacteria group bacterium]